MLGFREATEQRENPFFLPVPIAGEEGAFTKKPKTQNLPTGEPLVQCMALPPVGILLPGRSLSDTAGQRVLGVHTT